MFARQLSFMFRRHRHYSPCLFEVIFVPAVVMCNLSSPHSTRCMACSLARCSFRETTVKLRPFVSSRILYQCKTCMIMTTTTTVANIVVPCCLALPRLVLPSREWALHRSRNRPTPPSDLPRQMLPLLTESKAPSRSARSRSSKRCHFASGSAPESIQVISP